MTTCGHPVTWHVVVLGVGIGICIVALLLGVCWLLERAWRGMES